MMKPLRGLVVATTALIAVSCGDTLIDHAFTGAAVGSEPPSCEPGFFACGADCYSEDVVICDHQTCEVRGPPAGGVALCVGRSCDFTCIQGIECAGACLECPGPTAGVGQAACHVDEGTGAGSCTIACTAGSQVCGDACVPAGPAACGAQCTDCNTLAPAHASGLCTPAATCDFQCDSGFLRCGDACCQVSALAAGWGHTCAITQTGGLLCWGANDRGQAGVPGLEDALLPAEVFPAGAGVTAVAAGFAHTCVVVEDGVWCWGANDTGQLGLASAPGGSAPVQVGLGGAVAVAAGGLAAAGGASRGHSCAVLDIGEVWCWGANDSGQLGTAGPDRAAPARVEGVVALAGARGVIATGAQHTCALSAAGEVYCFGNGEYGQLGDGLEGATPRTAPVRVIDGLAQFVSAGERHTCAVAIIDMEDGDPSIVCFGANAAGQLGTGDTLARALPTPVTLGGVESLRPETVAAGRAHTCGLRSEDVGGLKCFGDDDHGQLGTPAGTDPTRVSEVPLPVDRLATAVVTGADYSCALLVDGGVSCFGANDRGQLGDGTRDSRSTPADVSGR